MAKNTGNGYRNGAVNNRTQFKNPNTNQWAKRGSDGKIMDVKTSDDTPFKGITKE